MALSTRRRYRRRSQPLSRAQIRQLEDLRQSRRWSYRELADDISRLCHVTMPEPTITKALGGRSILPTTAYPILLYLEKYEERTGAQR